MVPQLLPDPRRYITGNCDNGESHFLRTESEVLPASQDLGDAKVRLAYTTSRAPVTLANAADLQMYEEGQKNPPPLVPLGGGANVWYIDMPPLSESPMHRTVSLDFVIQITGKVELTMSSGDTRIVEPGDITIQRSSMHKWRNPSETEWSRMVGIMAECQPIALADGSLLQPVFPEH